MGRQKTRIPIKAKDRAHMSRSTITTETRNAELGDVLKILQEQRARRLDVVIRQPMIDAYGGNILVRSGESTQWMGEDGITSAAGVYRPTAVGDEGLAALL